jgi:hypothetical protein
MQHAAAVRLFTAAFAADRMAVDDIQAGHRYHAASCAVLAAAALKPHDEEKARLRRQALDWLRADLALWTKQAEIGDPKGRPMVNRTLSNWQNNPALASIRDQLELAKLPAVEREAWIKLWADVERLRAQRPKFVYVDLQPQANGKVADLAGVPKGEQTFGGVKLKLDGLITVFAERDPKAPAKVEGIKVGTTCRKLHFLHACHGSSHPDDIIGCYTVNYEDKTQEKIALVYYRDIANCWYGPNEMETSRARVVWKGTNAAAKKEGANIRLYMTTWENPDPKKKVVSIDFGSTRCLTSSPFCLAITAEK